MEPTFNPCDMALRKYGGLYQLRIRNAADLRAVLDLSETCWIATSAPCVGLRCDPALSRFLDSDNNGRIRTDEVRAAIRWALARLSDYDGVNRGSDRLRLADVNVDDAEGAALRAAAERILTNLNCSGADEISLDQVRDLQRVKAQAVANGDGIIPAAGAGPELAPLVEDIVSTVGPVVDAGGAEGVGSGQVDAFEAEARAYLDWRAAGSADDDILVWGEDTAAASALVEALRPKIDEYFHRCRLIHIDARAANAMRLQDEAWAAIDFTDPAVMTTIAREAAIAEPNADETLDLAEGLNPHYRQDLEAFRETVVRRLFGAEAGRLDAAQWRRVTETFAAYQRWATAKKGVAVEPLGADKLRNCLEGSGLADLRELIERDKAVAPEIAAIAHVERLILYQAWLLQFVNNFVSFPHLYDRSVHSLFQIGTLILGGRELTFNIRVDNIAEHKTMAAASLMFVLYVEVVGTADDATFVVATPVTAGDAQGLRRGRRGVFRTTDGKQWDARVVDIIASPISLWEAVKTPFVRIGEFLESQAEKFTSSRYTQIQDQVGKHVTEFDQSVQQGVQQAATAAPPPPAPAAAAPPEGSKAGVMRDMMLSGSVSVAALASSFAFVTKTLAQVTPLKIFGALLIGFLALILPLVLMGALKLRRRNISSILEASGWAINGDMRLRSGLGHLFTRFAEFPPEARKEKGDFVRRLADELDRTARAKRLLAMLVVLVLFTLWLNIDKLLLVFGPQ